MSFISVVIPFSGRRPVSDLRPPDAVPAYRGITATTHFPAIHGADSGGSRCAVVAFWNLFFQGLESTQE